MLTVPFKADAAARQLSRQVLLDASAGPKLARQGGLDRASWLASVHPVPRASPRAAAAVAVQPTYTAPVLPKLLSNRARYLQK